jgi:dipeptidyl aminopeptidase/acylaminoacyl peptidase
MVTPSAADRTEVEFISRDVTLRGWLYRAQGGADRQPGIVMSHGWGATKEMFLDDFASSFAVAGFAVLVYDNRNFGESEGEPRQEIQPWLQVEDYLHAITYIRSLPFVDQYRIGIWGTSFSGGHVLVTAGIDRRVRCVVSQVPTISGWESTLRRNPGQRLLELFEAFAVERDARYQGEEPALRPLHAGVFEAPAGYAQAAFYDPSERNGRLRNWRNEVTLLSLEHYAAYEVWPYVPRIAPTPLMVITETRDVVTPTDLILRAYNSAAEPKQLVILDGEHYDVYTTHRAEAAGCAVKWFRQHLCDAADKPAELE